MMTKTVVVTFRGVRQSVKVPCNGRETHEELQQAAVRMLRARENRQSKEKSERLLKELGIV